MCDHHDFNYWIGCTEPDRKKADQQFYRAMVTVAKSAPWWKRSWLRLAAWTYFRAVRRWGAKAFHYGPCERTLEDLKEEMRAA